MHVVVCYDITDDGRRRRLFKRLKRYLKPVQRSVFEGPLPQREHPALRRMIEATIDQAEDTVRIYHLTAASFAQTELLGTSPRVSAAPEVIII